MVNTLIFDVWGTIIEHGVDRSPSKFVKKKLGIKLNFQEFITTFQTSLFTEEYETLREGFENVASDFNKDVEDETYEDLIGLWNKRAMMSHMYQEVEEALGHLKGDYEIVLLANMDNISYNNLEQKYGLEDLFDEVYTSFDVGYVKGNPKFYKYILDAHDIHSDEALMVGDSIKSDMESAEKAGIDGVLMDRRDSREYEPKVIDVDELKLFLDTQF